MSERRGGAAAASEPVEDDAVTVVLVDDSSDVRSLIKVRLSVSGRFRIVGEGSNGFEAIAQAREQLPDLVLLDVSMPGMDGLEALPKILEASPGTRVVMFSGFAAEAVADEATRLGAADFIEKSTPLADLVRRLLDAVGQAPPSDYVTTETLATATEPPTKGTVHELRTVLDEHLERFKAVFDEAAIGMATLSLAGRFVRANRAMVELLGEPRLQIIGRRYVDVAATNATHLIESAIADLVEGAEQVVQVEHTLRHRAQTVVSAITAIRESGGSPLYLLLQAQDLTEHRRAETALQQLEERSRLLVESIVDYAIFMLDAEGYVASWNAGAQRKKGYRADEIIGQHFRVFYTPEDQAAGHPEDELRRAAEDGRYEEEGWRVRKDGSRFWANVVITPLHVGRSLVGFAKVTREVQRSRKSPRP